MSNKVARANNNVTANPSMDSGMYHATALHAIIRSTWLSEATAPTLCISISNVRFTTSWNKRWFLDDAASHGQLTQIRKAVVVTFLSLFANSFFWLSHFFVFCVRIVGRHDNCCTRTLYVFCYKYSTGGTGPGLIYIFSSHLCTRDREAIQYDSSSDTG